MQRHGRTHVEGRAHTRCRARECTVTPEERKTINRLHLRVVNALLRLHRFTLSREEHDKALAGYEQAVKEWEAYVVEGVGHGGQG